MGWRFSVECTDMSKGLRERERCMEKTEELKSEEWVVLSRLFMFE